LGPYQPLSWISLAIDWELWGQSSPAHHAMNIVYHALTALCLYFVARRLLAVATGLERKDARCDLAAAAAALLFAVHPLRVESVAWASERRDVLSGFLLAATILAYLRALDQPPGRRGGRTALGAFCFTV